MLSYKNTADEIVRANPEMAVLAIGSIEQHGPHLPLGTDWMVATEYGARVAEALGAYSLPALPYSTCREHMGKKGSVWIDPDVFYDMVMSILMCLKEQGFKKVVILPCHGGIFILPPIIRQVNAKHNPDFMVALVDEAIMSSTFGSGNSTTPPDRIEVHAGAGETSSILFIAPETVKMELAEPGWPTVPRPYLNYGSVFRASPNGVWGDPTTATAERGREAMELRTERAVEVAKRIFAYMEGKEKFGYSYF